MFRVLFLVRNPAGGWERIAKSGQSLAFVLWAYFIPLMLITTIGEGLGVARWRTLNSGAYGVVHFTFARILVFETLRVTATLAVIGTCAYFLWLLKEQFNGNYRYKDALMVVMCSFGPLIVCQLLSGVPQINLWIPWGIATYFSLNIFYHGVRFLSQTDPRSAEALFFLSSGVIIALAGAEQLMLFESLTGHGSSINTVIVNLAAKLPIGRP